MPKWLMFSRIDGSVKSIRLHSIAFVCIFISWTCWNKIQFRCAMSFLRILFGKNGNTTWISFFENNHVKDCHWRFHRSVCIINIFLFAFANSAIPCDFSKAHDKYWTGCKKITEIFGEKEKCSFCQQNERMLFWCKYGFPHLSKQKCLLCNQFKQFYWINRPFCWKQIHVIHWWRYHTCECKHMNNIRELKSMTYWIANKCHDMDHRMSSFLKKT